MKTFNELTRQELAQLNETQIDAYVDIELAQNQITKPIYVVIDYPNYLKVQDALPEKDVTIYEVDGYSFPDTDTAQKLAAFIGTLPQVKVDYNWDAGSENKYVKNTFFITPSVSIIRAYSEAKYEACKETIKRVYEKQKGEKKENDKAVDDVIDYDAIDRVKYEVRDKVRAAIDFFARTKSVASNYDKYFQITNDEAKAYETLFTVYNIQDQDFKDQVVVEVAQLASQAQ